MFEIARVECIESIVEKRRNCSSPFPQYLLPFVKFPCYIETRFSLGDKGLFEISEIEITRVNYNTLYHFTWAKSAVDKLAIYFLFFQRTGFAISCKSSP